MKEDYLKRYSIQEGADYLLEVGINIRLIGKVVNMNARQIMFVDNEKGLHIFEISNIKELRPIKNKVEGNYHLLNEYELADYTIGKIKELDIRNKSNIICIIKRYITNNGYCKEVNVKDVSNLLLSEVKTADNTTKQRAITILLESICLEERGL